MTNIVLAVKSTIDKIAVDLSITITPAINAVDLDDNVAADTLLKSKKSAIVWEFLTMDGNPNPPMYSVTFKVGARTIHDHGNYTSLHLLDLIKSEFQQGKRIEIIDYSQLPATNVVGVMIVTNMEVDPQMFDKSSGIRLAVVSASVLSYG